MRTLPDPGFPGDDGAADPDLAAALAVFAEDPDGGYLPAVAALCGTRLLVPVVAEIGEVEHDAAGLAHDKSADMATVLMRRADGQTALLAFTSMDTLRGWRDEGRPVPAPVERAAAAAVQEGAFALLVDTAGPVRLAVEGEDLLALARGWTLVRLEGGRWGWLGDGDD